MPFDYPNISSETIDRHFAQSAVSHYQSDSFALLTRYYGLNPLQLHKAFILQDDVEENPYVIDFNKKKQPPPEPSETSVNSRDLEFQQEQERLKPEAEDIRTTNLDRTHQLLQETNKYFKYNISAFKTFDLLVDENTALLKLKKLKEKKK